MTVENTELRCKLEEMTESGVEPSNHRALLAAISAEYPNTIQPLESRLQERHYTCGMYALRFCEDEGYIDIAGLHLPDVHAGVAFFEWLLANHLLEAIDETEVCDGDLTMYLDKGRWKHVGICKANGRIESKWGVGLLYNHGLWEVPKNYGDEILFFRSVSHDEAIEHFVRYAESRGVSFEEED